MRLSLVVPTYNSLPFIKDLIEGIVSSTALPAEIVFVDGFSSDGTFEFIREQQFPCPIVVFQREPRGVYDAWNYGIEHASGDWVMVACADDLVFPLLFERLHHSESLIDKRDGFIAWRIDIVDEHAKLLYTVPDLLPSFFLGDCPERAVCRLGANAEALLIYLLRSYRVSFMSTAFRRQVWSERPFRTDIGASADIEWLLEAHLRDWGTLQLPETLAAWRDHHGSITGSSSRISRLNAHRKLQQQTLVRLTAKLQLSLLASSRLAKIKPAVNVYDYINAAREAHTLPERCSMFLKAISAAGTLNIIRLFLRRLGVNSSWTYTAPLSQAQKIAGKRFFTEIIREVGASMTLRRNIEV